MWLRKFTVQFDETIRVGGIGLALFFVFLELVYINSKSLFYLDGGKGYISLIFAIIGSMAYSSTTIAVMRRAGHKRMKTVLPWFDALLVFFGYNLNLLVHIETGEFNPMAFVLSIFIAVFTGVITYGLGMLNFEERTAEVESQKPQTDQEKETLRKELAEASARENTLRTIAEELLPNHIRYESWLSKKKNESNRNGYETKIDLLAEKLKQGVSISLQEYCKETGIDIKKYKSTKN